MRACHTLALAVVATVLVTPGVARAVSTTRVSVDSAGGQANDGSCQTYGSSISGDGRYVAFESHADNLVPGDTNGWQDIFVHDRNTGQTTRVSVSSTGGQGDDDSWQPSISADGRYVTFLSWADNLVGDDTNNWGDIFVHDRITGQTTRVSVSSTGAEADSYSNGTSISADGRYVTFDSCACNLVPGDTNGVADIFVHDRITGQTTRVSVSSTGTEANEASYDPSISADGRYVAFTSLAENLVGDDTNYWEDIFVHDRITGQTIRVSVDSAGAQVNGDSYDPTISADGRYVAFISLADNLVPGDTNYMDDIFVHDRDTGQTTRVSVDSAGTQANDHSCNPTISADGRYVAFCNWGDNLVGGDTHNSQDIFVHDRITGQTTRVSVDSAGVQANSHTQSPSISADGRYVAFDSWADNLVPDDTNDQWDVFVRDRQMLLTTSEPPADGSLPKTQSNLILCVFDDWIALPASGNPLVIKDMTNGCADVSNQFVYAIDPDDPNGRTLEARETDPNDPNNHDVLPDMTWYQINSAPAWAMVEPFQFEVYTLVGDCNNSGRVTTADYSGVKATLGDRGDLREDLNGSARVTTADYSVVKATLGDRAPIKPALCP